MSGQRRLEPVVDSIGQVGRGERHDKLDDLLLIEVLVQPVEIDRLDIPRIASQEVGKAEDCSLLRRKDLLAVSSARLLQGGDLLVGQPAPLARSGVTARSILAPVADRDPQVG
jgi:hypothetical protein